jgi:ankyrin repeat protein
VLIWATRSKRESKRKVQALLKAGADVNRATPGGWSPLMSAVDSGNLTTVELLISSGAKVNYKDKEGCTALHYAGREGTQES